MSLKFFLITEFGFVLELHYARKRNNITHRTLRLFTVEPEQQLQQLQRQR